MPASPISKVERPAAAWAEWFEQFRTVASKNHHHFTYRRNPEVAFTPLTKPLRAARLALVSTCGAHLKTQQPFDIRAPAGDWSFREIPSSATGGDLLITHPHYHHADADRDPNCVFPIDRLRDAVAEGWIGSLSTFHYGLMGFIPENHHLVDETGPEIARRLTADEVDAAILTPG